jgi:hypothetical protein
MLDGQRKAAEYSPSKQIDFRRHLGGNLIEYATVDSSRSLGGNDVKGTDQYTAKRTKRPRPDGTNDAIPKKRKNDGVTGEADLKSGEAEEPEALVDTPGQGPLSLPSTPGRRPSRPTSKALGTSGKAKAGVENAKNRAVSTRLAPGAVGPNTVTTPNASTMVVPSSIPRLEQPSQPNRSVGTTPKPITLTPLIAPSAVATPGTSSIRNRGASRKALCSAVGGIASPTAATPGPLSTTNPDTSKAPASAVGAIAPSTAATPGPPPIPNPNAPPKAPAPAVGDIAPPTAATPGPPSIPSPDASMAPVSTVGAIAPYTATTLGPLSSLNPDAAPKAPNSAASGPSALATSGPNVTCSTTKAPPSFGTPQRDARTPVPGSYDTSLSPNHTSRPQLQITSPAEMVTGPAEAPAPAHQGGWVGGNEDMWKQVLFCRKNRDLAMRALKEATEHYNQTSIEYDNAIEAVLGL